MTKSKNIQRLQALAENALPGTLSEVMLRCGKKTCGCSTDPNRRHGPHLYLKFRDENGRNTSLYIPRSYAPEVRRAAALLHDSDKPKGISELRLWGKIHRFNGINNLPVFMQQRRSAPTHRPQRTGAESDEKDEYAEHGGEMWSSTFRRLCEALRYVQLRLASSRMSAPVECWGRWGLQNTTHKSWTSAPGSQCWNSRISGPEEPWGVGPARQAEKSPKPRASTASEIGQETGRHALGLCEAGETCRARKWLYRNGNVAYYFT